MNETFSECATKIENWVIPPWKFHNKNKYKNTKNLNGIILLWYTS